MKLVLGAGKLNRVISDADWLLRKYREDTGYEYLRYRPLTPHDKLVPEDLAVTLLVNSQAGRLAFQSLQKHGESVELNKLPPGPLEQVSDARLKSLAAVISTVAKWPGFAASLATKVLHKKRPDLIPMLDNQAIFGAYMSPSWPENRASQDSVKEQWRIEEALQWIKTDLIRPENEKIWPVLREIEPMNSLIEIFDSVWWMYFRAVQPVGKKPV